MPGVIGQPAPSHPPSRPLLVAVDDDPRIREALQCLFDSAGIDSRVFATSEEALDLFQHATVDCLLTDLQMPGIDGWELQRLTSAAYPQLPIIVVTAQVTNPSRLTSPTFAILTKPFDGEELLRTIRAAFALEATTHPLR